MVLFPLALVLTAFEPSLLHALLPGLARASHLDRGPALALDVSPPDRELGGALGPVGDLGRYIECHVADVL